MGRGDREGGAGGRGLTWAGLSVGGAVGGNGRGPSCEPPCLLILAPPLLPHPGPGEDHADPTLLPAERREAGGFCIPPPQMPTGPCAHTHTPTRALTLTHSDSLSHMHTCSDFSSMCSHPPPLISTLSRTPPTHTHAHTALGPGAPRARPAARRRFPPLGRGNPAGGAVCAREAGLWRETHINSLTSLKR